MAEIRSSVAVKLSAHHPEGLLSFCNEALPGLRRDDGIFCFDKAFGSPSLGGRSPRYSVMVLLGLLRYVQSGAGDASIDLDQLYGTVLPHRDQFGAGDLGLLLWAEARAGVDPTETLRRLEARSRRDDEIARLEGMEVAWLVIGAANALASGAKASDLLHRGMDLLLARKSPTTPLFRHLGANHGRALLPNFATEVYSLLALAEAGRVIGSPKATNLAMALADTLISLRRDDGGWPWLFHADRGTVAEEYEVYSVHQDAMAPMALFALSELTGDLAYARAAVEGFQWCFGENELGFTFYDAGNGFAHRSIRRKGLAQRINLAANAAFAMSGTARRADGGEVEVNETCRPYHLGWILEAWSGREQLHALVAPR